MFVVRRFNRIVHLFVNINYREQQPQPTHCFCCINLKTLDRPLGWTDSSAKQFSSFKLHHVMTFNLIFSEVICLPSFFHEVSHDLRDVNNKHKYFAVKSITTVVFCDKNHG